MAQVIMPNTGQKDDALTTIMKGLSIAGSIYGIRSNMRQIEEYDAKKKKEADLSAGKYDKNEQLMLSRDFNISPDKPQSGLYQTIYDSEKDTPLYASIKAPKTETAPIIKEIAGNKDGVAGTFVKDYRTGKELDFIPQNGKTPNKDQFDAALYGKRVEASNQVLADLAGEGYDRTSNRSALAAAILPDAFQSSQFKRQDQAERNFINAVLRRESGSAIQKSEFESAEKQYFPRAGDTPEVLAQKEQNRLQALAGLKAASGNAWDEVPMVAKREVKGSSSGQAIAAPAIQAPKVGTVENGYIFIGGDPAKPESWKKK
jgi:hypothetical protein